MDKLIHSSIIAVMRFWTKVDKSRKGNIIFMGQSENDM